MCNIKKIIKTVIQVDIFEFEKEVKFQFIIILDI